MIDIVIKKRVRYLKERITQLITQAQYQSSTKGQIQTLAKLEKNWSALKRYLP